MPPRLGPLKTSRTPMPQGSRSSRPRPALQHKIFKSKRLPKIYMEKYAGVRKNRAQGSEHKNKFKAKVALNEYLTKESQQLARAKMLLRDGARR